MRQGERARPAQHRLSRRAILAGFAAALGGWRAAVADLPADLPGWGPARWGMNRAELAAAFGNRLVQLDVALAFDRLVVRDSIPDQRIAGRPMIALFQLDPRSERLAQVLLRYPGDYPMLSDFVALRDEIGRELGPPQQRLAETDYSGSFPSFWIEAIWRFATTEVYLSLVDPNAKPWSRRRKRLTLRYSPGVLARALP